VFEALRLVRLCPTLRPHWPGTQGDLAEAQNAIWEFYPIAAAMTTAI
jgi:hypothetical protein